MSEKTDSIVMGAGCFWCTEAVFTLFDGVVSVTPGYAAGTTKDPTYKEVCGGDTGHAEVAIVEYKPSAISLEKLLDIFLAMHDPTSKNRQGNDVGSQYRSIILYNSDSQKTAVERFLKKAQETFRKPIATEVKRLEKFYPAEDYHRQYFNRNPLQPYCMFVIRPKVSKIKKEFALG